MKNLLIILFFLFSCGITQAQQLSFDETVAYINEVFAEKQCLYMPEENNTGYEIGGIKVNKAGKVLIYNKKMVNGVGMPDVQFAIVNLFDIQDYKPRRNMYHQYSIALSDNKGEDIGAIFTSELEGEKLIKALKYLKGLCQEPVDPFGK